MPNRRNFLKTILGGSAALSVVPSLSESKIPTPEKTVDAIPVRHDETCNLQDLANTTQEDQCVEFDSFPISYTEYPDGLSIDGILFKHGVAMNIERKNAQGWTTEKIKTFIDEQIKNDCIPYVVKRYVYYEQHWYLGFKDRFGKTNAFSDCFQADILNNGKLISA